MILKTNLHLHASDDPEDHINYSFYQAVDRASALGFEVLALTCHNKIVFSRAYFDYAAAKNILLISGLEKKIKGKHVVILNPAPAAETIDAFPALAGYKKSHPESFILAPHPFFYGPTCLKKKLIEHHRLFDAIEHSWFYSRLFNRNKKAQIFAEQQNLPFITASDTHDLKFLDAAYALIESETKQPAAIFAAVRQNRFTNVSQPRRFWTEMLPIGLKIVFKNLLKKIDKRRQRQYADKYVNTGRVS